MKTQNIWHYKNLFFWDADSRATFKLASSRLATHNDERANLSPFCLFLSPKYQYASMWRWRRVRNATETGTGFAIRYLAWQYPSPVYYPVLSREDDMNYWNRVVSVHTFLRSLTTLSGCQHLPGEPRDTLLLASAGGTNAFIANNRSRPRLQRELQKSF